MSVKVIVTDMDGTFLNDAKTYNQPRFMAQYQELKKRGIVLVFGGLAAFALSKFRKKKEDGIVEEGLEFADDSYINEDEENAEDQQK